MKHLFTLICFTFLLTSCGSDDSNDTEEMDQSEMIPVDTSITYDKDIAPLLMNKCFNCHNDPTANGAPTASTWVNFSIVSANATKINFRVANGTMPPSGALSIADKKIISDWIANGLPEN